jgi:hypothetical protein
VIKNVFSIARDVQIGITIVVVIADGDAHPIVTVSRVSQTCGSCDVRKAPVGILAV